AWSALPRRARSPSRLDREHTRTQPGSDILLCSAVATNSKKHHLSQAISSLENHSSHRRPHTPNKSVVVHGRTKCSAGYISQRTGW
ncbi:MAG: hypothetical protein ACK43N_16195, partial [Pirellulaceae bacterium]